MIQVRLKRKYRPHTKDYYAKQCGFGTDDQNPHRHKFAGPKTYVKEDHVLVLTGAGKRTWRHA